MRLRIVTPLGEKVDLDVSQLTAPGTAGELGILPDHRPLLTSLGIGVLSYTSEGKRSILAIAGGYLEVVEEEVVVITETAETPDELDMERAQAALKRAKTEIATLASESGSETLVLALAAQGRANNRVKVAGMRERSIPR